MSILVAFLFLGVYPQSGVADVSVSVGVFIVDGSRYKTIGDAYAACTTAGYNRCEIWDYNLVAANGGAGEVMDALPWLPNGSGTPFYLHLGPGTLKICDTLSVCTAGLTFVIPKLSRVVGAGRTSDTQVGGTVIQAGAAFLTTGTNTLVRIGDTPSDNSFGVLLSQVTVDCNYKAGCTGIENSSAQEQSGIEHVNVINYATRGIYVHGSNAQNSHYTDVEVNGCLNTSICIIASTTVPFEIDNVPSLRPISGITVNPVNTTVDAIGAATCSGGVASLGVSGSTFTSGQYVSVSQVSVNGYNGVYQLTSGTGASVLKYSLACPGSGSGGSAALVPTYDVLLCSGSTCNDHSVINPTPVTFVGAHFEHGQYGVDVLGAGATLDLIGGSCPNSNGYSDVATCLRFESTIKSGHIENFYPGPATTAAFEDDTASPTFTTTDQYIQLYDVGAVSSVSGNRTRHCSEGDCVDQVSSLVVNGGSGGGAVTMTAPSSGTGTVGLPAASGTFAVSASPPLLLNSTTGALSVTCAAGQLLGGATPACTPTPTLGVGGSTNGTLTLASTGGAGGTISLSPASATSGFTITLPAASGVAAVSASAPLALSSAGAISVSGAAGQVPNGATGAFTATPTLGGGGTPGTLSLGNSGSGVVTLSAGTGTSAATLTLLDVTDTVALIGQVQTFTAQQSFNNGFLTSNVGLGTNSAHINTHAANKDVSGSCAMSSGACTAISFASTYASTPSCVCSWDGIGTLTGVIKCTHSTTSITPSSTVGTDTASVSYHCIGNPN